MLEGVLNIPLMIMALRHFFSFFDLLDPEYTFIDGLKSSWKYREVGICFKFNHLDLIGLIATIALWGVQPSPDLVGHATSNQNIYISPEVLF